MISNKKKSAFVSPSSCSGIGAIFKVAGEKKLIYHASIQGSCTVVLFTVTDFLWKFDMVGSSSQDAVKCGFLQNGDVLTSIDGMDIENSSMEEVALKLLGPHGSFVTVKFRRQTAMGFLDNTIVMDRRPVQLETIASTIVE